MVRSHMGIGGIFYTRKGKFLYKISLCNVYHVAITGEFNISGYTNM